MAAQTSDTQARTAGQQGWREIFFTSRDGLRLHARHYPAPGAEQRLPVLCLPGLTRNVRDFHDLAVFLSNPSRADARDVYAFDYRGRGRSERDPDWRNYTLKIELLDTLDLMTTVGIERSAIIGTSRGGLIAMLMGAARPACIGAVVLNDIGPVIEPDGLSRIAAYTGRVPVPATWEDAARQVADMNRSQFPDVSEQEWASLARQWFDDVNGRPAPSYDQNLGKSMRAMDGPVPTLWPQFRSLSNVPVLTIRGELSDLLSAETLAQMRLAHPRFENLTVPRQGHAPLLRDSVTQSAIAAFLVSADRNAHVHARPGAGAPPSPA